MMTKASLLIKWVLSHVGLWGYVYCSYGQTCTVDLLKQGQAQYGAAMGDGYYQKGGDYTKGKCARWLGKIVTDCSGHIKAGRKALSGVWQDVSAQGLYDQCSKRGAIASMPLMPGCLVFIYSVSEKRIGHVGIYVGGGKVVEARGVDYGVVETNLKDRAWTHWGQLDWMEYDLPSDTGKPVTGTQTDAGDHTSAKQDDSRMTYAQALDILHTKAGIDTGYWTPKAYLDPYFDDLIIKIATVWQKEG